MPTIAEGVGGLVGLARRGGRLAVGFEACAQAVAHKKAALVILAEDLSPTTAARFRHKIEKRMIDVIVHGNKSQWGRALGREEVGLMAVLDRGLAEAIRLKLKAAE
jgi:ribosomal protein L7Ae-like RNA K-turn-binding protein